MADYKYTQQSGDDWKVNTSDKADAYQDTNEIRAVVDDLGAALGHSKKDGSFPEDLTSGGKITQISFPATQVPSVGVNTLDDYKEGAWTAVIQGSGDAGTYEILSQYSNYTKIGRVVHLETAIIMAAVVTGGGTNFLEITGCPFTKMANSNPVGSLRTSGIDLVGIQVNVVFGGATATSDLYIMETKDDAVGTLLPISAIAANDVIVFSITFFE